MLPLQGHRHLPPDQGMGKFRRSPSPGTRGPSGTVLVPWPLGGPDYSFQPGSWPNTGPELLVSSSLTQKPGPAPRSACCWTGELLASPAGSGWPRAGKRQRGMVNRLPEGPSGSLEAWILVLALPYPPHSTLAGCFSRLASVPPSGEVEPCSLEQGYYRVEFRSIIVNR